MFLFLTQIDRFSSENLTYHNVVFVLIGLTQQSGKLLFNVHATVGEARSLPPGLSTECPVEWYNARRGTHFAQHELSLWAGTAREDTILPYSFVEVLWEFAHLGC